MTDTQTRGTQASGAKGWGIVIFSLVVGYLITGLVAAIVLAVAVGTPIGWLFLLIFPAIPISLGMNDPPIAWIVLWVFGFGACSFLVWKWLNAKGKRENGV